MKTSHWLSATFRNLSRREKAIVVGGAAVSVVALLGVYLVAPLTSRWTGREAEIQLRAEQLARLKSLIDQEDAIRSAVDELREERRYAGRRLLEGNTAAVAASGLQQLINRYAEESRVPLDRVDVAGDLESEPTELLAIPARLAGRADIYGLVDLLFYLQQGEKLLVIDDLRVGTTRAVGPQADLVTWSIDLHGYYASGSGVGP
jgi:type II secretory pathway component PulM